MATNNSILIFHRSKRNFHEDLTNQQAFLKANEKILKSTRIIDYMSGTRSQAQELYEVYRDIERLGKVIVIINSCLSRKEYELQYDLYFYLRALKNMGLASIHLMDHEGRLYKEVKTAEIL